VPWVQHTDLKAERRAGDNKVGDRKGARDDHSDEPTVCCWIDAILRLDLQ
jgi:hypothetical protein